MSADRVVVTGKRGAPEVNAGITPIIDPSTRGPGLGRGARSGLRPTGVLEGATGSPVELHRFAATIDVNRALEWPRSNQMPYRAVSANGAG